MLKFFMDTSRGRIMFAVKGNRFIQDDETGLHTIAFPTHHEAVQHCIGQVGYVLADMEGIFVEDV